MKPARRDTDIGIPGRVTPTSLEFTGPLTFEAWEDKLELLGRIGGSVNWWLADAINWGADRFGEQFAQGLNRLSASYATQTLLNVAYVGRTFPPSRRRGLPLTFSHFATIAGIENTTEQETWLDKASAGETLPNGEVKSWSVTRLRAEVRASGVRRAVAIPSSGARPPDESLVPGCLVSIHGIGRCTITAIMAAEDGILPAPGTDVLLYCNRTPEETP